MAAADWQRLIGKGMSGGIFRIIPLDGRPRDGFASTSAALNRYFHRQASQDFRRRVAACFVALHHASDAIAGFYTLSAAEILLGGLPAELAKRLPHYPALPAARLGRLAVDHRFAGQKLGAALLADAVLRASASEVAVWAMVADAKDQRAAAFYRHHGFVDYGSASGCLIAPLAALRPPVRAPGPPP